jgi:aliphatic nitrilase
MAMVRELKRIRLAAVQAAPVFLEREATVQKACRLIEEAGREGADVIVFPEGFIPGFPHWYEFYPARHPKVRELLIRLLLHSVEVPGPVVDALSQAARRAGAYVVMGINERLPHSAGTLYNAQLIFDRQGRLVGHRRKIMPTFTERLVHTGGDGRDVLVVEAEFGGLGALICGENSNPLLRYTLLAQGEVVHAASWPAFPLKIHTRNLASLDFRVRNYAFENRVFVASAAGVFTEQMADEMGLSPEQRDLIAGPGAHSLIVNPHGEVLAGPYPHGETILYADADLTEVLDGRTIHHVAGHYQRFDIFQLHLNRQPLRPLHEAGSFTGVPLGAPAPQVPGGGGAGQGA